MEYGTISVQLDGNKTADLQVEEFHPIQPSSYQWEAGWTCYDLNSDMEYFVSVSGEVWKQPENNCIGIAPVIKAAGDRLEAMMAMGGEE